MWWRLGIGLLFVADLALVHTGCGRVGFDGAESPTDAHSDATTTEDAASPFCASLTPAPAFCDDFDGAPLAARWTNVTQDAPGTVIAEERGDAPSGARALRTDITPTTGECLYNVVELILPGRYQRARLEFEVFVPPAMPLATAAPYAALIFSNAGAGCQLLLFNGDVGEQTIDADDNRQYEGQMIAPRSLGVWHHVAMDYTITPGAEQLLVAVDDEILVARDAMFACLHPTADVVVKLGMYCVSDPAQSSSLRFDNVVVRAE